MAKKMTMDDLARMVQGGFNTVEEKLIAIEGTMVTKDELQETRVVLAQAIKDLEMHTSAYMNFNREEIDRLKVWMESIESRVTALEKQKHKK